MLPSLYLSGSANVTLIAFRLRVLRALSRVIEEVNPDNGYHFDLRNKVFRGRQRYDSKDPIPMISILEAPIPQDVDNGNGGANTGSRGEWELLIQGFASDDRNNPSDPAHQLMAEVKSVLAKQKKRDDGFDILGMNGRVQRMKIGQGSVRPADEPTVEAFFWLTLTLQVSENLEEPYQ